MIQIVPLSRDAFHLVEDPGWSRDLQTTLGYMHLAKGETERAIRLLDEPFISPGVHANGNLTATEPYADQNTAG